jgi:hypothetical protein
LANALKVGGLDVWYDEFELRIGDSLRRKIDQGLAKSRFGIVVLSKDFFRKGLDQLRTRWTCDPRRIWGAGAASHLAQHH